MKKGMVSGGQHHQNLFDLNLGKGELDRDIKKLQIKIKQVSEKLEHEKEELKTMVKLESELKMEITRTDEDIERVKRAEKKNEKELKENMSKEEQYK